MISQDQASRFCRNKLSLSLLMIVLNIFSVYGGMWFRHEIINPQMAHYTDPHNFAVTIDSSRAAIIAGRLNKGIVLDVTPASVGMPINMLYGQAQLDAIKAAGFQSIRIYIVALRSPDTYKTIIDDALERGLAVVISLWGSSQWISDPIAGIQDFVEEWEEYSNYDKDYPDDLVLDLWNEPAGLIVSNGKPQGITEGGTVMKYLDAVIPVIRKTNPDRILGIGGPGIE